MVVILTGLQVENSLPSLNLLMVITGKLKSSSLSFEKFANLPYRMRFWETYGFKALAARLRMDAMRDLGPCMSPFNAWMFLQGLETLPLRGQRHVENTLAFAKWLQKSPYVA